MKINVTLTTILAIVAFASCGETTPRRDLPKGPVSIRGWVARVDGVPNYGQNGYFPDLNAYVDGIERVSGGVGENGAFIILGVPPGDSTIVFQAPGVDGAAIHFEGLPPRADVLLPGVVLSPEGATIAHPSLAKIRIPNGQETEVELTDSKTTANGVTLPTYLVPIKDLGDRLNYPVPAAPSNVIPVQ